MNLALPRLLQLCSPALPVGAYAYSQGLEYAVERGWVRDEASAGDWILGLMDHNLCRLDLPIFVRLHQGWQTAHLEEVQCWNARLYASREAAELQREDAHLGAALAGRSAAVKALLLNQEIIAGVGNIYADEALFAAGIAPLRAGGDLSEAEVTALHNAVRRVLAAGIAARGSSLGGSSLQNYLRPSGEQGGFQEQHQVFRRTGKPCRTCGQPIERIIVAQRSTHYCPHCQR